MQERDEVAVGARSRRAVDRLVPFVLQIVQRGPQVGHAVAQVMHPGAAALQEPRDGGIGAGRRQELDASGPRSEKGDLHSLRLHYLADGTAGAEQGLPYGQGFIERRDGDPDVIKDSFAHCGAGAGGMGTLPECSPAGRPEPR